MSTNLEISLTEKQILHAWLDNPDLVSEDNIFITEIGNELQFILLALKDNSLSFIPEHILKNTIEFIDERALQAVIDTQYQNDKIDFYIKELQENAKLIEIENKVNVLSSDLLKKGTNKIKKVEDFHNEVGYILDSLETQNKKPYTFFQALSEHEPVLEQRAHLLSQHSGCYMFDRLMPHIVPGLAVIGGYSGSMKTTFVSYLAKQRIQKRLPSIYVNTELSFNGLMDSMIASMIKEPYYDILGISDDRDMIDYNSIMGKYDSLMYKYVEHNMFRLWPKSSCSIEELKKFVIDSRKAMNLNSKTTLFAFVDLMSMLEEFNGSEGGKNKADIIEKGVNVINDIGLSTNTLIIGTVQLKRTDPVKKIERMEDIEKFRPTLASLKSSGAWEERSRFVMLLHNPFHIVSKTPCSPIIRDMVDPVLEVTMMKDTYIGNTGETIKYYFDAPIKSLTPYEETEGDTDESTQQ